jgi:cytoplasmic iron level regulating protein YaaA (DUF328/UPF0246 family)
MRILLPPSETKRIGTSGNRLRLDQLTFPELEPARLRILRELIKVSKLKDAPTRIGISERMRELLDSNTSIWNSPTSPAIEIYDGVLFDALDFKSLSNASKQRATESLLITSAAFGLVGAGDFIPAYRLSATSKLLKNATLSAYWNQALRSIDIEEDLIIDLRSGSYENFWSPHEGVNYLRIKIMELDSNTGRKQAVSHFNKATKGKIAREFVQTRKHLRTHEDIERLLTYSGWKIAGESFDRRNLRTIEVLTKV